MISTQPSVSLTGRYELKETAEALKVDRSTILRWTQKGKIRAGIKKSNNRKFWLGADIIRFWKGNY